MKKVLDCFHVRTLKYKDVLESLHDADGPLAREKVHVITDKAGRQVQGKSNTDQHLKTRILRECHNLMLQEL